LSEARESMERMSGMLTAEMEKKISMLAVLGTWGPMIGLLGTLKGMIGSFSAIARSGRAIEGRRSGQGHFRSSLADVRGVSLSVPSIFFFALFRNRCPIISVTALGRRTSSCVTLPRLRGRRPRRGGCGSRKGPKRRTRSCRARFLAAV